MIEMNPEVAKAALAFLARADLKGQEVPVFIAVCQALDAVANTPAPESKSATEEGAKAPD